MNHSEVIFRSLAMMMPFILMSVSVYRHQKNKDIKFSLAVLATYIIAAFFFGLYCLIDILIGIQW